MSGRWVVEERVVETEQEIAGLQAPLYTNSQDVTLTTAQGRDVTRPPMRDYMRTSGFGWCWRTWTGKRNGLKEMGIITR